MKTILSYLTKNWVNFRGRSRRKEYWLFALFASLTLLPLYYQLEHSDFPGVFLILFVSIYIWFSIGNFSLLVRRLHDINKSAWCLLFFLIPFVNLFYTFLVMFKKGTTGVNKYGKDPREVN